MRKIFCLIFLMFVSFTNITFSQDEIVDYLSPIQFGGKKLPSWLNSEWSPIFNGVNQYASCPTFVGTSGTSWTVMTWIKPFSFLVSNYAGLVTNNRNVGGKVELYLLNNSATGVGYYGAGGSGTGLHDGLSRWTHTCLVCDSATTTLYIDGIAVSSAKVTLSSSLAVPFVFGRFADTNLYYGNTAMSETSFWNRALSQSEILRYKDKRLKGIESGLVALYHMNEGPGNASQTLVDSVGGKNATCYNSVQWTRRNGYSAPDIRAASMALSFDGVDDVASGPVTGLPATGSARTLSAWIFGGKASGFGYAFGYGKASTGGANFGIGTLAPNGLYVDTYGYNYYVPATFSYGWNFVCLTLPQGGTLSSATIYFNGSPITAPRTYNAIEAPNIAMNTDLSAGARVSFGDAPQAGNPFQGRVAEGTIWNRALSQSEIQSYMYSTLTGSETGLVRYYKFNEGTGSAIKDYASGHYDATLYNSPTWVGRDIP